MSHTPEPWEVTDLRYIRQSNEPRHVVARASKMDGMDANARRIVACVNACATMPTDDLEEMVSVGGNIRNLAEFADELRKQRDDLLAALVEIADGGARNTPRNSQCAHGQYSFQPCELCILDFARQAIAAAKARE